MKAGVFFVKIRTNFKVICVICLLFHASFAQGIDISAANNVTLTVGSVVKSLTGNVADNLTYWAFCQRLTTGDGPCDLPGPLLEFGYTSPAKVIFQPMPPAGGMMGGPGGMPFESPTGPYPGHTIHHHGVDLPTAQDGVPETQAVLELLGATYDFSVSSEYVGSHLYHCHQHTVKHLEMGMYGALIVRDDGGVLGGPYLNNINTVPRPTVPATYDDEWIFVFSTVDPSYHAATAVGDSPVFSDYNPVYFLINGKTGLSTLDTDVAESRVSPPGQRLALRLIGIHSVNAEFSIRNAAGNVLQDFEIHNADGHALPNVLTVNTVKVSPGQTKDIIFTVPSSGVWYPQVTYTGLRKNFSYQNGTVYTKLTVQ